MSANPTSANLVPDEVLDKIPLLAGMTERERKQLAGIGSLMEFKPGEVVVRQGKTSQNLLVLLEGQCQVVKEVDGEPPHEVVLAELKAYDHFGDMSFFSAAPHSASVRAVTPVNLLRIQRRDYDKLIGSDALAAYKVAYNMVDVLAHRLRRMDEWVSELVKQNSPDQRVSEWNKFRDKLFTGWNL